MNGIKDGVIPIIIEKNSSNLFEIITTEMNIEENNVQEGTADVGLHRKYTK